MTINTDILTVITEITNAKGKTKGEALKSFLETKDPESVEALKEYLFLTLNPRCTLYITLDPELKKPMGMFATKPTIQGVDQTEVNNNILPLLRSLVSYADQRLTYGDTGTTLFRTAYSLLSPKFHPLLDLFILRNLKAGFGATSINKVIQQLIPIAGYMRCDGGTWEAVESMINKYGYVFSQEKHDGMFLNVVIKPEGEIEFINRDGNELKSVSLDGIHKEVETMQLKSTVLQGECLVYHNGELMPRASGNGLLNSIIQTGKDIGSEYQVVMVIWDKIGYSTYQLAMNNKETEKYLAQSHADVRSYDNTLSKIEQLTANGQFITAIHTDTVSSIEKAKELFLEILRRGGEGTVIKAPSFEWFNGTSKLMLKFKSIVESDFIMVSTNEGDKNGKYAGMVGSVNFESSDGLIKFGCSGLTDDLRKRITDNPDEFMGFVYGVRFSELMRNAEDDGWTVSFPRIISEKRLDKQEADSYDEVVANMKKQLGL